MGERQDQVLYKQMVKIFIFVVIIFSAGCCTFCKQDPCLPVITKPTPPPAEAFIRPALTISTLDSKASASDVLRAYVLTTDQLVNHSLYLERLLQGYK